MGQFDTADAHTVSEPNAGDPLDLKAPQLLLIARLRWAPICHDARSGPVPISGIAGDCLIKVGVGSDLTDS